MEMIIRLAYLLSLVPIKTLKTFKHFLID